MTNYKHQKSTTRTSIRNSAPANYQLSKEHIQAARKRQEGRLVVMAGLYKDDGKSISIRGSK